jgi:hypothetical protein
VKDGGEILKEVADEYRKLGYDVRFKWASEMAPVDLGAQMIALSPEEKVVVTTKDHGPAADENVRKLLTWVAGHPSWRLELLVPPSSLSTFIPSANYEVIDKRIRAADRLAEEGSLDEAAILLWVATEALLWQVVARGAPNLDVEVPEDLLNGAVSHGLINKNLEFPLQALATIRNAAAHGVQLGLSWDTYNSCRAAVSRLQAQVF